MVLAMPERKKTQSSDSRDRRLRAALRANLKRRKAQARGRAAPMDRPTDTGVAMPRTGEENTER